MDRVAKIPINFTKDTEGNYKRYSAPSASEKLQIEKRIFNYAYGGSNSLGNGDHLTTNDGYKYRVRGGIQTTGRANYRDLNSKLKLAPYNLSVNVLDNPELVAEMPEIIVYSVFIRFNS